MKILVCDTIQPEVLEELKKLGEVEYKPEDLMNSVKDAEVMVVRSKTKVTKEVIDQASKLKAVIRAGVGLDSIDTNYCKEKNIQVINTPHAPTNTVAELGIGLMICLMRGAYQGHYEMKDGKWLKKELLGTEIQGKTLGIVGFGRIGHSLGEKAHALGMNVLAYDPHPRECDFAKYVELDELYSKSDVISLHSILIPETKGMINKNSIAKMNDGVFIINLARGELIVEEDLYQGLKDKIAGAALDVYWGEKYSGKLLELDNVFFTPHIGGNSKEAQLRIGEEVIEAVKKFI